MFGQADDLSGLIDMARDQMPMALLGGAVAMIGYNELLAYVEQARRTPARRAATAAGLALASGMLAWQTAPDAVRGAWGVFGGFLALELLGLVGVSIGQPKVLSPQQAAAVAGLAGTYTRELYPYGGLQGVNRLNIEEAEDPLLVQLGTYQ
jgi:hypothetical protein